MKPEDEADDDQIDGEDLAVWPPETWDLELRKPVQQGNETITVLSLREPTGEEWETIYSQPAALQRRKAVSVVAGIPMSTAAKIGIGDLIQAEEYLHAFFQVGQAIGAFWAKP